MYQEKKRGTGPASIEDSVDASILGLENYIEKQNGGLIRATGNDADNTKTNRMTITRKQKCEEKQLYGGFTRLINITLLRKGHFKRETESLLMP